MAIADLITFPVCKSSINHGRRIKTDQAGVRNHADGLCSKLHIEEDLKFDELVNRLMKYKKGLRVFLIDDLVMCEKLALVSYLQMEHLADL